MVRCFQCSSYLGSFEAFFGHGFCTPNHLRYLNVTFALKTALTRQRLTPRTCTGGPVGKLAICGPQRVIEPPSVKRIEDIFDHPEFFVDGASAGDIRQGRQGDCWFLSALSTMCKLEPTDDLIDRVCVARDPDVGVYGFLVFRDGEWTSVIIDDKLYLREPDFEFADLRTRSKWEENRIRVNSAEECRKEFQTNSRSLYFAQSAHPDETWVPLIEKAFAKSHGDYGAINGGFVG